MRWIIIGSCYLGAAATFLIAMVSFLKAGWFVNKYGDPSWRMIGISLVILILLFGAAKCGVPYLLKKENQTKEKPCSINPFVETRMVSRLYVRKDIGLLKEKEVTMNFGFQELFYEYTLRIPTNGPVERITVQIEKTLEDDRFSVTPSSAIVSQPQPRWFSGFPEPDREKPDYFSHRVRFKDLSKGESAVVQIRRRLDKPLIQSSKLIRLGEITASSCTIVPVDYDPDADAIHLQKQAMILAHWVYNSDQPKTGLPIRDDPGDVTPEEVQATVEAWCADKDCNQLTIRQFEVHMGKSPEELTKAKRGKSELNK